MSWDVRWFPKSLLGFENQVVESQIHFLTKSYGLAQRNTCHQMPSHSRSAGSTLRSRQRPLGRPDSECVRLGNLLCCRALLLLCLCASKGVWWILEQPMSSCMEWHPLFQRVIRMLGMRKSLVSMANYGGPTEKKTYLYSSISIVEKHLCFCLG